LAYFGLFSIGAMGNYSENQAIMKRISHRVRRAAHKGFTLLELLVVLLIIALLAGYVGPKLFSQVDKAKVKAAQAQMKTLGDALTQYRLDTGSYPSVDQGLNALAKEPQGVSNWNGPYLAKAVPADPWGHSYQYHVPGRESEADLISLGRDGREGGSSEDADLYYDL
jgi:general secretion pathway protein G